MHISVSRMSGDVVELKTSSYQSLSIGSILLIAGLFIIVVFARHHTLTCSRAVDTGLVCVITHTSLFSRTSRTIQGDGQIQRAYAKPNPRPAKGGTRVELETMDGNVPLEHVYSTGQGARNEAIWRINRFLADENARHLSVSLGYALAASLTGGLLMLPGIVLLLTLRFGMVQLNRRTGKLLFRSRTVLGVTHEELLLRDLQGAFVYTETFMGNHQHCVCLKFYNGTVLPLTRPDTGGLRRKEQIALIINKLLKLPITSYRFDRVQRS